MQRPEAAWQEQDMAVGMLWRKGAWWRKLMNGSYSSISKDQREGMGSRDVK